MQILAWSNEFIHALFQDIKQLNLKSIRTKLALKTSVATMLAVFISWLFHIQDPYWAGISAIMVLQASRGATIERAFLRVLATIIAVLWAVLLVMWSGKEPALIVLLSFLTMVFNFYYARKTDKLYAWLLGPGTFLTVLFLMSLSALTTPIMIHLAYVRSLEVVIGTGCALLCAAIYPINAAPTLKPKIKEMLRSLANLHTHYVAQYSQKEADPAFEQTLKALSVQVDQYAQLRLFAQRESLFKAQEADHANALEQLVLTMSEFIAEAYYHFKAEHGALADVFRDSMPLLQEAAAESFARLLDFSEGIGSVTQVEATLQKWSLALDGLENKYVQIRDSGKLFNFDLEASLQWQKLMMTERALHQLLQSFYKGYQQPQSKIILWRQWWGNLFGADRYFWLYAIKAALPAIGFPLVALYFHLPGAAMLGVWVVLIMQMDGFASKRLSFLHIIAFVLGTLATFVFLSLHLSNPILYLLVFMVFIFPAAYIFHGPAAYSYVGAISGVMFISGVITNPGMLPSWPVILMMFATTIAAMILLAILNTWIWPFTDSQKMKHALFQVQRFHGVVQAQLLAVALHDQPMNRSALNKLRQYIKELGALTLQHDRFKPKLTQLHQAWQQYYYLLSSFSLAEQTLLISPELKDRLSLKHFTQEILTLTHSSAQLEKASLDISTLITDLRRRAQEGDCIPIHDLLLVTTYLTLLQNIATASCFCKSHHLS